MEKTLELYEDVILHPQRAVFLKSQKALVIGDLHIGMEESELINFRVQTKEMLDRLFYLIDLFKAEKVILNGDIKHSFNKNYEQAESEIKVFFERLSEKAEIIVIKGNHDNYLQSMLPKKFQVLDFIVLGKYVITHGHKAVERDIPASPIFLIGNEHPVIILRDEIEVTAKIPCFLVFNDMMVLPAFNPLSGGANFLSVEKPLSEYYFKKRNFNDAEVYGINEDEILCFGKLKDLKKSMEKHHGFLHKL